MRRKGKDTVNPTLDKRRKRPAVDGLLLVLVFALIAFGMVMIFSASYYTAEMKKAGNGYSFLFKQAFGVAVGTVGMVVFALFDYRKLRKLVLPGLIVSLILCVMVWVPGIGLNLNGARRWLNLGISVQPSEVAKLAVILFVAQAMSVKGGQMRSFMRGIVPVLGVTLVFAALFLAQPNMSMAVSLVLVVLVMLFLGGAKIWQLALISLGGAGAGMLLIYTSEYRWKRYTAFLDPWADPLGTGYQVIQSLYALANGGLFGTGLGNSKQKYLYLPYSETDFIFAIIAEEFGFAGALILIASYALLVWRGMKVALSCKDSFGMYLAAGIVANLALQVVISILVVTATVPTTGLPLPFISYGGSSVTLFMAQMGILLNISRNADV